MERVVVLADLQIPFEDTNALAPVVRYLKHVRPDMIVLLGDILDFESLSTKFLRRQKDPEELLEQLATASAFCEMLDTMTNRLVFIEGNHELRLTTYIQERAPELSALAEGGRALTLPSLLDVPGMEYYGPYGSAMVHRGFVFKHGDYAGKHVAQKELLMEGSSGMSGHNHRFSTAMKTDRKGAHAWYSIGALCNIKGPDMPPGRHVGLNRLRDQQQGFAEILFDSTFNVYPIVVTDGQFIAPNGQRYA
jgi:predicted phosphodiesterase